MAPLWFKFDHAMLEEQACLVGSGVSIYNLRFMHMPPRSIGYLKDVKLPALPMPKTKTNGR